MRHCINDIMKEIGKENSACLPAKEYEEEANEKCSDHLKVMVVALCEMRLKSEILTVTGL